MLRSDAKPLSFLELQTFMEKVAGDAAPVAVEAVLPRETKPAPSLPAPLEHCPHCNGRLSALDLKFGQCLTCRKPLEAKADGDSQAAPVSIGI
jgi:hypothetical protein